MDLVVRRGAISGCFAVIAMAVVLFAFPSASFAADQPFWRTDYQQALKDAKADGKLILLHFYADWCMPCKRMERETLSSYELSRQFGEKVIAVKVNGEHHPELLQKFAIQSYPSDVFITPDERIEAESANFMALNDYLRLVSKVEKQYYRAEWIRQMREKANEEEVVAKSHAKPNVDDDKTIKLIDLGKSPLALDGYSPVTLRDQKEWIKGKEDLVVEHEGFTYRLKNQEEVTLFQQAPEKYVPRLLGCDPVEMWEKDKAIYGTTRYGAYYNGDLYLFVSDYNRQIFKESPVKFTQTRHVQKIDEIEVTMK